MMKRPTMWSPVGVLLCSLSIEAQILTGTMIGVVRDESRGVLPGATVTVRSPAMPGGPVTLITGAQGEYRFTGLPPGVYELTVTLAGFRTYVEPDLPIAVGGTVERNVTLPVATVAETITVSGQAPVVDPRQTGVVRNLPVEVVEAIPQNRQGAASAFLVTLPGVTARNYGQIGGVIIMGSGSGETSYLVDGMLMNNVNAGTMTGFQDFDAIQDINAVTLGASVEYQQAQGGVMNLVSKSGTNQWRGDGLHYWAPSSLTSAPIKLPCKCPLGETGYKLYKYRDYGYHAGGFIIKDRLWYYGGVSNAGPSARFPGAPDTPEQYRWVRDEYRSNHKWTWKINEKMTFNQAFYYEWWHWSVEPDFPTPQAPLETTTSNAGNIIMHGSELTATLTPNSVLTARWARMSYPSGNVGYGPRFTKNDITTPAHIDVFTGVASGNRSAPASVGQPVRDGFNVKLNQYVTSSRVNHDIRFGVQMMRQRDFGQQVQPSGVLYQDFNGAPFQAQFTPPSTFAAQSNAIGVWAENEMNFGQRLTIVPGLRFDRMKGISPPARVVDTTSVNTTGGLCRCIIAFPQTGATVEGLGDLFTWTKVSPRVGVNVKLTEDGKMVLRANAGRYYRPIALNDFTGLHPGISAITLAGFDPATGRYPNILSVTNPRDNIALDRNIEDPSTDQYSVGLDREVMNNVGVSVTYVHKRWRDQVGWTDIGGVYGAQQVTAPNGQVLTVYPRLNSATAQKFLRTNPPGFFSRYNGLILSLTRRHANRWMANVGYTYSITEGLQATGNTGRDPNDLINRAGRLKGDGMADAADRPHVFTASGAYEIPRVTVQVSGNLQIMTGIPYGAQFQVRLPQGLRNIYYEAPGAYRHPTAKWLHLRADKILLRRGPRHIELGVELRNALQETSIDTSRITEVFTSPNFGVPPAYPVPRQLMFRVRAYF